MMGAPQADLKGVIPQVNSNIAPNNSWPLPEIWAVLWLVKIGHVVWLLVYDWILPPPILSFKYCLVNCKIHYPSTLSVALRLIVYVSVVFCLIFVLFL
jgi:hypothetical protein